MIPNQTIILNTLADNAADFNVDSEGFLRVMGARFDAPNASTVRTNIQVAVSEVLGVSTATFTAPASIAGTIYQLTVYGNSSREGNVSPNNLSYTYTAEANDTVTTVATAFRNWINNNVTSLQITATSSAGVLTMTARAGYPVIEATTTNTAYVGIVQTTLGVPSRGQGTSLATNPIFLAPTVTGSFTAGAAYTRIMLTWQAPNQQASASSTSDAQNIAYVFINEAATSSGSDNAAVNRALILNSTYGTAYQLKAGYRAVSPTTAATTTAAITVTTGVITLASGSVTFNTLGAKANDLLVINTGTAFSTFDVVTINSITTATTGVSDKYTATTAAAFKFIAVRAIPLGA